MGEDALEPPRRTPGPRARGRLRQAPEDFRVEEIPAYAPGGRGEHCFVRFEKTGLTTPEAVARIARALGVDPRGTGFAGLKDRVAIAVQWASFAGADPERALALGDSVAGVRVLEAACNATKLRTGHLRGNRFALRIRAVPEADHPRAAALVDEVARHGFPNYFGEQRFGLGGRNLERARRWLVLGGPPPRERFERKLLVSSLQSALFNAVAETRVRDHLLDHAVPGDLLRREDTGGLFTTADLAEAERRVRSFEVSPTGPMFGARMRWPEQDARAREEAALADAGVTREHLAAFERFGAGSRRALRVRPENIALDAEPDSLILRFDLPSGAYATVLLREIFDPRDGRAPTSRRAPPSRRL
jgi:tRNA pseudouridine13 synthase